ncbi:MAG: hypothetical protein H6572_05915 [Lewinellaceae bacterium]|nr:hypothetical protein [Lewinellaceae bacterium]
MNIKRNILILILSIPSCIVTSQSSMYINTALDISLGNSVQRPPRSFNYCIGYSQDLKSFKLFTEFAIINNLNTEYGFYNFFNLDGYDIEGYEESDVTNINLKLGLNYCYSLFFGEVYTGLSYNTFRNETVYLTYTKINDENDFMKLSFEKGFKNDMWPILGFRLGIQYPLSDKIYLGAYLDGIHIFNNQIDIEENNVGDIPLLNKEQIDEMSQNTIYSIQNEILYLGFRLGYKF